MNTNINKGNLLQLTPTDKNQENYYFVKLPLGSLCSIAYPVFSFMGI